MARRLTKSKLLSFRQCPKRLWLEVYSPELAEVSAEAEQAFAQGDEVASVARSLYGEGPVIEWDPAGEGAIEKTHAAIAGTSACPVYEATFLYDNVLVRTDVLIPLSGGAKVVEVKSSTSIKDVHREDCAIQSWVLQESGLRLQGFYLAHVNNRFVYAGDGQYQGLLTEVPLNAEVKALAKQIPRWVKDAKAVLGKKTVPRIPVGAQCNKPYACPFMRHCWPHEAEYPLSCLPNLPGLSDVLAEEGYHDIRDIPEGRLGTPLHERIRRVTASGEPELDPEAREFARNLGYPRYYLDFETISFAVPIWAGVRPYQSLPVQWSCHIERQDGVLDHAEFLDLSGEPPMRAAIEKLIGTLGDRGPVLTYSHYEKRILQEATVLFPDLMPVIDLIIDRLVDLLPVLRKHYYHRDMKGSWSIKAVLPTIDPTLAYEALDEVRDGTAAQQAYREAIAPMTGSARRRILGEQLRKYCALDTQAMVAVVAFLEGTRNRK